MAAALLQDHRVGGEVLDLHRAREPRQGVVVEFVERWVAAEEPGDVHGWEYRPS